MTFGPDIKDIPNSSGVTSIPVAGTATVYTRSFSLRYAAYFALAYKATSDGNVNLKIELEQSWTDPTTEGSADANYVVPEGASEVDAGLTDENWHNVSLSPVAVPKARFKITGLSGNDDSTVLQLKLSLQQSL